MLPCKSAICNSSKLYQNTPLLRQHRCHGGAVIRCMGTKHTEKAVQRMAKGLYKEWTEGDGLIKVQGWARKGLSNDQIAENIGINRKTLYEWCNKYSNFRDALKKTKEITVYEVEDAMFKAAKGYFVTETKTITNKDGKVIRIENHKKWIAPSTTAQIFFLKNKDPENWRERNDISITESNGVLESLMALHKQNDNVE